MSAEDSEILSITNSAVESFNKSDSFRSIIGSLDEPRLVWNYILVIQIQDSKVVSYQIFLLREMP